MNWVRVRKQPDVPELYWTASRLLFLANKRLAADAFVTANDITSEMQYHIHAVRYPFYSHAMLRGMQLRSITKYLLSALIQGVF